MLLLLLLLLVLVVEGRFHVVQTATGARVFAIPCGEILGTSGASEYNYYKTILKDASGILAVLDAHPSDAVGKTGHILIPARGCLPANCPFKDPAGCGTVSGDAPQLFAECARPNVTISPLYYDLTYYFGVLKPSSTMTVISPSKCDTQTTAFRLRLWIVPLAGETVPKGTCTNLTQVTSSETQWCPAKPPAALSTSHRLLPSSLLILIASLLSITLLFSK
jgi:hypothetical protein